MSDAPSATEQDTSSSKTDQSSGTMKRFHLQRKVDETGISGTGRVAEGVVFSNGWVSLAWMKGGFPAVTFYSRVEDVLSVHGHQGKTILVFEDP